MIMSIRQYERLRGAAWERLTAAMDALGKEAAAKSLTDAKLEAIPADESCSCRSRHERSDQRRPFT